MLRRPCAIPVFEPASAAKAIDDAFWRTYCCNRFDIYSIYRARLASALCAAADQLTPYSVADLDGAAMARNRLLDIAAKLERM
jgi:hypothetical protein